MRVEGRRPVPRSREATLRELLMAVVSGALGSALRITHRDGRSIELAAPGPLSGLFGPSAGRLEVTTQEGETLVGYSLCLGRAVAAGGLLGGLAGAIVALAFEGTLGARILLGAAVAGAWAGLWAVWHARRTRVRAETLLHNLRYLS